MSTRHYAESLALDLLVDTGLADVGWTFGFDRAKRRFGLCHYMNQKITVSAFSLPHRTEDDVRQTLLHEVAHALVGGGHGHDDVWLAQARALGYVGGRCGSSSAEHAAAVAASAPWIGTCDRCDLRDPRLRRPKVLTGWKHRGCGGAVKYTRSEG
jgi:SprT-like family